MAVLEAAEAHARDGFMASAFLAYGEFLDRWPAHALVSEVQVRAGLLVERLGPLLADEGLGSDAFAVLHRTEQLQQARSANDRERARRLADALLHRQAWLPALNELSLFLFDEGETDEAVSLARQVVLRDRDNLEARCNLAIFLALTGRQEQSAAVGRGLAALQPEHVEQWVRVAEAMIVAGADENLLDLCRRAACRDVRSALLHHFAAVAHARAGHEESARKLWKRALRLDPDLQIARDNLDDMGLPPGKRTGAWSHADSRWLPAGARQRFLDVLKGPRVERLAEEALALFREFPILKKVSAFLVARGDPIAYALVVTLALVTDAPSLEALLPAIALGQRGIDDLRTRAANEGCLRGVIPPGMVKMWFRGQQRDVLLLRCSVSSERPREYPPCVGELLEHGLRSLARHEQHDGYKALWQALALAPAHPEVVDGFAAALTCLGREAEAEAMLRQLNSRKPAYVPAAVSLAERAVRKKRLQEARAFLEPLLDVGDMHLDEFRLMCRTWIGLHAAEKDFLGVASWLSYWRNLEGDNPEVKAMEKLLGKKR